MKNSLLLTLALAPALAMASSNGAAPPPSNNTSVITSPNNASSLDRAAMAAMFSIEAERMRAEEDRQREKEQERENAMSPDEKLFYEYSYLLTRKIQERFSQEAKEDLEGEYNISTTTKGNQLVFTDVELIECISNESACARLNEMLKGMEFPLPVGGTGSLISELKDFSLTIDTKEEM